MPAIRILLPAYNEEDSLPALLPKVDEAMRASGTEYEIVVVDDGSTDGTAEALKGYAADMPLHVISHVLNRGLGEAERDGFEFLAERSAPEDIVVRLDCDDTHDPKYIFSLVEKLNEGYDVVNTSRFQPGGGQTGVNGYRATISYLANIFMKCLFRISGTRDYSCGFRAYRAEILQDAIRVFGNDFIQLKGMGFTGTLEMIVKLHLLGARFAEVPFVLRYDQKRSASKMVSSITTLGYLTMAVLCYWPFGGWASQYRGLRHQYRFNRDQALQQFGRYRMRTSVASSPQNG